MKCQYGECKKKAIYHMGWNDPAKGKVSGMVCGGHDRVLGRINLISLSGMSNAEVINFEKYLSESYEKEDFPDFSEWLDQQEKKKIMKAGRVKSKRMVERINKIKKKRKMMIRGVKK